MQMLGLAYGKDFAELGLAISSPQETCVTISVPVIIKLYPGVYLVCITDSHIYMYSSIDKNVSYYVCSRQQRKSMCCSAKTESTVLIQHVQRWEIRYYIEIPFLVGKRHCNNDSWYTLHFHSPEKEV